MRSGFLLTLVLAAGTSTASAQQRAAWIRGPAASVLFTGSDATREAIGADTTARLVRPTHWKQGMLIGGVIGGVGLSGFVYTLCKGLSEGRDSCIGAGFTGAALGAVIGGAVGALVGGQFHKNSHIVPAADSTAASPQPAG
jgi:hypothetical protein